MNEWRETTLGDIAEVQTGPFGSQLHHRDYVKVGTPIITVEHLVNDKIAHVPDIPKVSDEDKKRLVKYSLEEGDIVFSRVGAVDRCGYVSEKEDGWMFSGRLLRVRVNKKIAVPQYIYLFLAQDKIKEFIRRIAVGTTMPSLNTTLLSEVPVILPDIEIQKSIAAILSCLDNKIDLLRRQNDTLEQIAQTLFKRWFVEFEFPFEMAQDMFSGSEQGELFDFAQNSPNEAGKPYKSSGGEMVPSELGEIPMGWRKMPLYEIATYINGAAFKLDDFSEDNSGLPIIKIAEMKYGITSQTKYTTNKMEDKYYIDDGEILFSWSGSPETSINIFLWSLGRGILNQHTFRVLPNSDEERVWLFYLLKSLKPLFIHIAKQKQTTGLGHVTRADLQEMLVSVPDHLTIKKFDDVVRPIFTKYFNNEKQIQTLTRLRDTLLPKLMSGKIRTTGISHKKRISSEE